MHTSWTTINPGIRNLESSEGSKFGSNPSMGSVNGLLAAAREGFRLMRTDRNFQGLVYEISTDTNVWSAMQGAAMRNRSVQNYLKTGDVSGFVHQHFITAEEERSETESAGTGLWATIWQIVEVVFLGKWIWDMIKGIMEKLFGGEAGGSVDVDLDVESRRMRLQLALLVTILIYMGVIAMRIALI